MNIKGLMSGPQPAQLKPVDKVERAVKSDITHDRDSNGRQEYSQTKDETPQRSMTEEELNKALDCLSRLKVVKEHHWTVILATEQDKKFVLIKDNLGTVIRRIPERELWSLNLGESKDRPGPGQILRKIA
jgi:uncharacterized FlaG/YvyC family protein